VAVVLALLSSLMWGSADFLGGLQTRRRPALAVVAASQGIGLLAVGLLAALTGAFDDPAGWVGWSVGAGLVGATGLVAFYAALASGTMGVVSPIAALGVVVPVVAGLLQGETPAQWQVAGIVLAVLGVLAASGPELSGEDGLRSVLLAAFAGTCFGTVFVCLDQGAESSPTMTMVGMRLTSVALFLVIAVAVRSIGGLGRTDLPVLTAIGVFDVGANLLFAIASTHGFVTVVAVLGSLYPVATVLLARTVLHERLRAIQQAGVVVTFGGVALIVAG